MSCKGRKKVEVLTDGGEDVASLRFFVGVPDGLPGLIVVLFLLTTNWNPSESTCWWLGTVVERPSVTGELSLSCARPAADR